MATDLLSFPNPVNEKAARTVAAGVLLISVLALSTQWLWLLAVLVIGFALRVASGPTLSPLGQLATRVVAPRLGPARPVPGPPKRFAQTIGLIVSGLGALAWFGFSSALWASVALALLVIASGLESIAGICLGCLIFGYLMRIGVIPAETCEACNNVAARYQS